MTILFVVMNDGKHLKDGLRERLTSKSLTMKYSDHRLQGFNGLSDGLVRNRVGPFWSVKCIEQ
uniref:Uncharacterized protein n=1 Tax=Nelumbo nucifera TaxID=4432 RepID=A0A822YN48_NELNU|nr:TPA_asm: hypothetical protein HUJ06_009589 [Nelumbo nucifera]